MCGLHGSLVVPPPPRREQQAGSAQPLPSLDSGRVAECEVGCRKELPPQLGSPQAQLTSGHTGSGPRTHPSLGVGGPLSPLSVTTGSPFAGE